MLNNQAILQHALRFPSTPHFSFVYQTRLGRWLIPIPQKLKVIEIFHPERCGTHFTETSSVNIYRMSASLNTNRYNPPAENDFRIEQKRVNFIFETKKNSRIVKSQVQRFRLIT